MIYSVDKFQKATPNPLPSGPDVELKVWWSQVRKSTKRQVKNYYLGWNGCLKQIFTMSSGDVLVKLCTIEINTDMKFWKWAKFINLDYTYIQHTTFQDMKKF